MQSQWAYNDMSISKCRSNQHPLSSKFVGPYTCISALLWVNHTSNHQLIYLIKALARFIFTANDIFQSGSK